MLTYVDPHIYSPVCAQERKTDAFADYHVMLAALVDRVAPFRADPSRIKSAVYAEDWQAVLALIDALKWSDHVHAKSAYTHTLWRYDNGIVRGPLPGQTQVVGKHVPQTWTDDIVLSGAVYLERPTDFDSPVYGQRVVEVLLVKDKRTAQEYENRLMGMLHSR